MKISEIIRALGGAAEIAKRLRFPAGDVGAKRVRAWSMRGSIPAEYWEALAAYSKEDGLGVTLEVLAASHANRVDAA